MSGPIHWFTLLIWPHFCDPIFVPTKLAIGFYTICTRILILSRSSQRWLCVELSTAIYLKPLVSLFSSQELHFPAAVILLLWKFVRALNMLHDEEWMIWRFSSKKLSTLMITEKSPRHHTRTNLKHTTFNIRIKLEEATILLDISLHPRCCHQGPLDSGSAPDAPCLLFQKLTHVEENSRFTTCF